jgi:hypothetical protein
VQEFRFDDIAKEHDDPTVAAMTIFCDRTAGEVGAGKAGSNRDVLL